MPSKLCLQAYERDAVSLMLLYLQTPELKDIPRMRPQHTSAPNTSNLPLLA